MENSITRSVLLEADAKETTPLLHPGQHPDPSSTPLSSQPYDTRHDSGGTAPAARPRPDSQHSRSPAPPSQQRSDTRPRSRFWPRAAILCGALSLVADLGDGLTAAPEVRLLETAVCRDYYLARDPSLVGPPPLRYVREELCKRDAIQVELAYLRALKGLFAAVPGGFTASQSIFVFVALSFL